jgi:hypothetical protein
MRIPAAVGTECPDLGGQHPDLNPADGHAERLRVRLVACCVPL